MIWGLIFSALGTFASMPAQPATQPTESAAAMELIEQLRTTHVARDNGIRLTKRAS